VRQATGIVIPVYLPPGSDREQSITLLRDTIAAYRAQVAEPGHVCLSGDGETYGGNIVRELADTFNVSACVGLENKGKFYGAMLGTCLLLENPDLHYIAVVDQDGDHFANELPNFVRAAEHTRTQSGDGRVMVLGRRISRHRPMGFLRGELEELADRVLLDALHYHAAMTGVPLRLEYATLLDEMPDFHSGYKLFDRATAEAVFMDDVTLAGCSERTYYQHACEVVMSVEALESGARLVVVNRSTFNEQPVTMFGKLNQVQLTADMIIWPCKRLGVPATFVKQWLANHAPRLLLNTVVPEGQEEIRRIRELVLTAFDNVDEEIDIFLQPLFI
jgi:hypothetical protein